MLSLLHLCHRTLAHTLWPSRPVIKPACLGSSAVRRSGRSERHSQALWASSTFSISRMLRGMPLTHSGAHVTLEEFRASLTGPLPPPALDLALQALWWDAHGNWDRAHACAQVNEADPSAAWVHAYLHRKEGDLANAAYWYRRAGRPAAQHELEAEWVAIAAELLTRS